MYFGNRGPSNEKWKKQKKIERELSCMHTCVSYRYCALIYLAWRLGCYPRSFSGFQRTLLHLRSFGTAVLQERDTRKGKKNLQYLEGRRNGSNLWSVRLVVMAEERVISDELHVALETLSLSGEPPRSRPKRNTPPCAHVPISPPP